MTDAGGNRLTIMVVEDDAPLHGTLAASLSSHGYKVVETGSPKRRSCSSNNTAGPRAARSHAARQSTACRRSVVSDPSPRCPSSSSRCATARPTSSPVPSGSRTSTGRSPVRLKIWPVVTEPMPSATSAVRRLARSRTTCRQSSSVPVQVIQLERLFTAEVRIPTRASRPARRWRRLRRPSHGTGPGNAWSTNRPMCGPMITDFSATAAPKPYPTTRSSGRSESSEAIHPAATRGARRAPQPRGSRHARADPAPDTPARASARAAPTHHQVAEDEPEPCSSRARRSAAPHDRQRRNPVPGLHLGWPWRQSDAWSTTATEPSAGSCHPAERLRRRVSAGRLISSSL